MADDEREADVEMARYLGWINGPELGWPQGWTSPGRVWQHEVPRYHTDPAAVFGSGGLVEAMAEKGWRLDMACPPAWPDSAVFTKSGCKSGRGDGDTPARAVARAALAAVKERTER